MPERRYRRVDNLSRTQRLHRDVISQKDKVKSLPSLSTLKGQARALFKDVSEYYPNGIEITESESLPPELEGLRLQLITRELRNKKIFSLRDIVGYKLYQLYSGGGVASLKKFRTRAEHALQEAFELHKHPQQP